MNAKQLKKFMLAKETNLVEAMQLIDMNASGMAFVVDADNHLCGAVSDGDIRRWILKTGTIEANVVQLMNTSPKYIYSEHIAEANDYMRENAIRTVPVVDKDLKILDIILDRDTNKCVQEKKILQDIPVVIMAGGKGTRLYPYTQILPKPLIPIGGIPIVERIINCFYDYGATNFFMTVNYRKNMIQSYFSEAERPYDIAYIEENMPLGTAGSIKLIQKKLDSPFFVTNCDILIRTDYSELYQYHLHAGNVITIVTAMKNDTIPYGVIYSGENGEVERIEEKPQRSYFVNTGMYIINPEIIKLIPRNRLFHMTQLIEKAIKQGKQVGIYPVSEDSFLDMGEFEELKRMEEKLKL